MKDKVKKTLKFIVSLAIAAAFLYWAFRKIDFAEFWSDFCQTRWGYILLSVVAAFLALVFRAERWRMQLAPLSGEVTFRSVWHASNIGNILSILLPGVGEFARCGLVTKGNATYDKVFGTIIVERAWDVLAILVLFVSAFLCQREILEPFVAEHISGPLSQRFNLSLLNLFVVALVMALIFLLLVLLLRKRVPFFGKCVGICKGIISGVASFSKMRRGWLFIVYTVAIWFCYISMSWLTFLAIPGLADMTFADAVFVSAIGNLASVVPTPGNIGPYHWLVGITISNLYLGSAVMMSDGLLFATLSHGSHVVFWMLMGLYSYFYLTIVKRKSENN